MKWSPDTSRATASRSIDGPFSDYYGIVEEVDAAKERIRVVASMFNRETPVELGLDQVEYAEEE